jgi:hypothetical protein
MSDQPKRIQRRRTKGSRLPPNTICVCRPGPLGNPFPADAIGQAPAVLLHCHWLMASTATCLGYVGKDAEMLDRKRERVLKLLPGLRGSNLACWCALCPDHAAGKPLGVRCTACEPCHTDALLEIANA